MTAINLYIPQEPAPSSACSQHLSGAFPKTSPLGICTEKYLLAVLSSLFSIWVVPSILHPDVYYLAS